MAGRGCPLASPDGMAGETIGGESERLLMTKNDIVQCAMLTQEFLDGLRSGNGVGVAAPSSRWWEVDGRG